MLASLATDVLTAISVSVAIPPSWITVTAPCASGARARRVLQGAWGNAIIYIITITVPTYATPAQTAAVIATVVWSSTATLAQLNAAIQPSLATLTLIGAVNPQVVGSIITVNGVACTGQACADLFNPPPAQPPNTGAIIGGVIGGVAVFVIFVLLVVACRRGDACCCCGGCGGACRRRNQEWQKTDRGVERY